MKTTVVIVPLSAVPVSVPLRFEGKWWKRRVGVVNQILPIGNAGAPQILDPQAKTLVAARYRDLRKQDHPFIVSTIGSTIGWKNG